MPRRYAMPRRGVFKETSNFYQMSGAPVSRFTGAWNRTGAPTHQVLATSPVDASRLESAKA